MGFETLDFLIFANFHKLGDLWNFRDCNFSKFVPFPIKNFTRHIKHLFGLSFLFPLPFSHFLQFALIHLFFNFAPSPLLPKLDPFAPGRASKRSRNHQQHPNNRQKDLLAPKDEGQRDNDGGQVGQQREATMAMEPMQRLAMLHSLLVAQGEGVREGKGPKGGEARTEDQRTAKTNKWCNWPKSSFTDSPSGLFWRFGLHWIG